MQIVGVLARPDGDVRLSAGHPPDVHEPSGTHQVDASLLLALVEVRAFGCGHRAREPGLGVDEVVHGVSGRRGAIGRAPL